MLPIRKRDSVSLTDQEPVLRIAVESRRNERPHALETYPLQTNSQPAVLLLFEELVRPAIPGLDGSGAVLAGRDLTLERRVVERMILDMNREVP